MHFKDKHTELSEKWVDSPKILQIINVRVVAKFWFPELYSIYSYIFL